MTERPFVHLHCHSHYSLLDGACRIPELVARTKELGMNAVALTDHGNLYGAVELYRTATDAGVKPVIGYEAYVAPAHRTDRSSKGRGEAGFHLTLLAKNNVGFKNLIKMASVAFLEGYYYIPRIDKELMEAHSEGVVCLSGCLAGEFNDLIRHDKADRAVELAGWFEKTFGEDFYIELQNNGLAIQDRCTEVALDISKKVGIPTVATADTHYLKKEDAGPHDVLICINTKHKRSDANRMRYGDDSGMPTPYYLRSPEDMYGLFPDLGDAVARSQEVADKCNVEIDFKARYFPVFRTPERKSPEEYLRELCRAGLIDRYGDDPPRAARDRLEHEMDTICRMGFAAYFLIVWDFVRFALEEGIPASARGSGCGSIACYVLKISHVCPLEYELLFERFLDPNRAEAPDIDIDFCQDRREDVIQYVKDKYGSESVAQIATFGVMAAKAAIKDVGRVLDIDLGRVNMIAKYVPERLGASLDDALKESPEFRREYEIDPQVREWIDIARKLEGTNRNAGTHAAGVVIADGPITDYVPVHRVVKRGEDGSRGGEPVITTQWVMGDLEKVGMLKMDFLGLRTLTALDNAVRLIEKTRGEKIDLYALPLDDAETYKLLQRGDAKGVFQFESDGIRAILTRLKPDNIHDIIACTALYRPGPLKGGMVDEYIDCKHGRKQPSYPHPVMKEVLEQTHGVMVFQEQVMRIINRLGGIELASAYACIKAISKKKHAIIDRRRAEFLKGAVERNMDEAKAKEMWHMIEQFAGYGFNRSHSAAYAVVSYQTAYLKAHYKPEFMAALLTSEVDDGNKRDVLVDHIADAKRLGVEVLPPDVNQGDADFAVVGGRITYGLTAIKGVGRSAAECVAAERRENGPYTDLYDFCDRVDPKTVLRAAVERLIKAGAFDSLTDPPGQRSRLFAAVPGAIQASAVRHADRKRGQGSLFAVTDGGGTGTAVEAPPLPDVPPWPETELLKYEKEVLDRYITSHPLTQFEREIRSYSSHAVQELKNLPNQGEARLGGMLTGVRFFTTKRGQKYARCKLEDFTGEAECVMWPDSYGGYKELMVEDGIVLAEGTVEQGKGDEPIVVLTKLMTLDKARGEFSRSVILKVEVGKHDPDIMERVARSLRRARGTQSVFLMVVDAAGRKANLRLGDEYRVDPAKLPTEELEMMLGPGGVQHSGR